QSARAQAPFDPSQQFCGRQSCEVLLVEPVEFFGIEHRVAAADALEREERNQLVLVEQLAIPSRRPPKQRKKVDHRLWKEAEALIFHHRRGAMALAQALLVRTENERHMGE